MGPQLTGARTKSLITHLVEGVPRVRQYPQLKLKKSLYSNISGGLGVTGGQSPPLNAIDDFNTLASIAARKWCLSIPRARKQLLAKTRGGSKEDNTIRFSGFAG